MRGKIAIFLDHPRCSNDGVNAIMNILSPYYQFNIITRHEMPSNWLNGIDMIAIPGGIGDSETFHWVMKRHKQSIKQYIKDGGRYLGICMGAYWAGSNYFDILKDRDCVQYLGRPNSDTRRPHAKNMEINWLGQKEKMFWYDGCSIIGSGAFDTVATYPNGDAMAGYQGRIGLIGCHPEADKSWYDCYSWMKKQWNVNSNSNKLLLEFVNNLMNR